MEFNKTNVKKYMESLNYGKVVDINIYFNEYINSKQAIVITIKKHIIWKSIITIKEDGSFGHFSRVIF